MLSGVDNLHLFFVNLEDPLNFFEDTPKAVPNAVLKLFIDLFSTAETAALFYSNDNKVLIDILVRQLSDLSAGDAVRADFVLSELNTFSQRCVGFV